MVQFRSLLLTVCEEFMKLNCFKASFFFHFYRLQDQDIQIHNRDAEMVRWNSDQKRCGMCETHRNIKEKKTRIGHQKNTISVSQKKEKKEKERCGERK